MMGLPNVLLSSYSNSTPYQESLRPLGDPTAFFIADENVFLENIQWLRRFSGAKWPSLIICKGVFLVVFFLSFVRGNDNPVPETPYKRKFCWCPLKSSLKFKTKTCAHNHLMYKVMFKLYVSGPLGKDNWILDCWGKKRKKNKNVSVGLNRRKVIFRLRFVLEKVTPVSLWKNNCHLTFKKVDSGVHRECIPFHIWTSWTEKTSISKMPFVPNHFFI